MEKIIEKLIGTIVYCITYIFMLAGSVYMFYISYNLLKIDHEFLSYFFIIGGLSLFVGVVLAVFNKIDTRASDFKSINKEKAGEETQTNKTEGTELIICAAIRCKGKIYRGHRHNHCITAMNDELSWNRTRQEIKAMKKEQGFMTSKNRFVSRVEAAQIASEANQILEDTQFDGISLYSEEIY